MIRKHNINDYAGIIAELGYLNQAKTFVEIGVNKGETTISLCESAQQTGGHVYGFDLWETHGLLKQYPSRGSKEVVHKLLSGAGYKNYTLTKVDSFSDEFKDIVKQTVGGKIDIAFIDACHSYRGCLNDLQAVYPLLSDTGIVVFHDTQRIDGCREFVYDLRTKYYDGTYDIFDLPCGYKNRMMGISFLVKRSFPTLRIPINQICGSLSSVGSIEQQELDWYNNEIEKSKNNLNLMDVDVNTLNEEPFPSNLRPNRNYLDK
jgi:hypothetical protein